jgi:hypothetical protein
MDLAEQVRELMSPTDIAQGTHRLLAERGHLQVAFRDGSRRGCLPPPTPLCST